MPPLNPGTCAGSITVSGGDRRQAVGGGDVLARRQQVAEAPDQVPVGIELDPEGAAWPGPGPIGIPAPVPRSGWPGGWPNMDCPISAARRRRAA